MLSRGVATVVFSACSLVFLVVTPANAQSRSNDPHPLPLPPSPSTVHPYGAWAEDSLTAPVADPSIAIGPIQPSILEPRATYFVNSTADIVDASPGNGLCATSGGVCTLRAALQEVNAGGDAVILVPGESFVLSILPAAEPNPATGDLNVISGVTAILRWNGVGTRPTIFGSNPNSIRVLHVAGTLVMEGIDIRSGKSTDGGCVYVADGGIFTFKNAEIVGCSATSVGGAVYMGTGSFVSISNAGIYGNSAAGVAAVGTSFTSSAASLIMENVDVNGNTALDGDSIINVRLGWMYLTNVTVTGNQNLKNVGSPTGIAFAGISASPVVSEAVVLNHVTITENISSGSYVGLVLTAPSSHPLQLRNTISSANMGPVGSLYRDCAVQALTLVYDVNVSSTLITDPGNCAISGTNLITIAGANLGMFGGYGSRNIAWVHPLDVSSIAIDRGDPSWCATTDARGVIRSGNGTGCDLGAYELILTDLVANTGFEPTSVMEPCVLAPWKSNAAYPKDKPAKNNPRSGECAFEFKSNAGKPTSPGSLKVSVAVPVFYHEAGSLVVLRGFFSAAMLALDARISVKLNYADGTSDKANVILIQNSPYIEVTVAAEASGSPIVKALVKITDKTASGGTWYLDDVRVFASKYWAPAP